MPSEPVQAERRRFYRIDDSVALTYRLVPEDDLQDILEGFEDGLPNRFTLHANFVATSHQMRKLLEQISDEAPHVGAYLEALNRKLDLLAKLIAVQSTEVPDRPTRRVNLSAGGMAFHAPDPLPRESTLEIKLVLFPSYIGILTYATVVDCHRDESAQADFPYRVGVDFTHIREPDREVLVRHVLRKQAAWLRELRLPRTAPGKPASG
jgi:hypothetical protein